MAGARLWRHWGNDNPWGQKYADILNRIMAQDFNHIFKSYDRAIIGNYAGGKTTLGRDDSIDFWLGLRASFPKAEFKIHHQIGMDGDKYALYDEIAIWKQILMAGH